MGIDSLDILFRLERRFGVRFRRPDLDGLVTENDITAGDLHALVCNKLRAAGQPVPVSSWNGVRLELANALSVSPLGIRRESRLIAELGMS